MNVALEDIMALISGSAETDVVLEAIRGFVDEVVATPEMLEKESALVRRSFAKVLKVSVTTEVRKTELEVAKETLDKFEDDDESDEAQAAKIQKDAASTASADAQTALEDEKKNLTSLLLTLAKGRSKSTGFNPGNSPVHGLDDVSETRSSLDVQVVSEKVQPPRKKRNVQIIGTSTLPGTAIADIQKMQTKISNVVSPFKAFMDISTSSRGFRTGGRLVFKSIGEQSAKGELKADALLKDDAGRDLICFFLGNVYAPQWKTVHYDDFVEVEGMKPMNRKDVGVGLVAYSSPGAFLKKVDTPSFPEPAEDYLQLTLLDTAKEMVENATCDMILYVTQVYGQTTRPLGDRTISCQEISVRDHKNYGAVVELMQEAVGIAKMNTFVLVKRMKTFRGTLQVWGSSMLVLCPEDLHFDVSGPVLREL